MVIKACVRAHVRVLISSPRATLNLLTLVWNVDLNLTWEHACVSQEHQAPLKWQAVKVLSVLGLP